MRHAGLIALCVLVFASHVLAAESSVHPEVMAYASKVLDYQTKLNEFDSACGSNAVAVNSIACTSQAQVVVSIERELQRDANKVSATSLTANDSAVLQQCIDKLQPSEVKSLGAALQPVQDAMMCSAHKGESLTSLNCLAEASCNMVRTLGMVVPVDLWQKMIKGSRSSECLDRVEKNSCLTDLVRGLWKGLVGSLKSNWEGIKWLGSAVGSAAKNTWHRLTGVEDASSDKMHAVSQMTDAEVHEFSLNPITMIKNIFNGILGSISQFMRTNFACEKWAGAPFKSECTQVAPSFDCAGCAQKMAMMCGFIGAYDGFATGELLTAYLTGGAAGATSALARMGAGQMEKVAARIAAKSPQLAEAAQKATRAVTGGVARAAATTSKQVNTAFEALRESRVAAKARELAARVEALPGFAQTKTVAQKVAGEVAEPVVRFNQRSDQATSLGFEHGNKAVELAAGKITKAKQTLLPRLGMKTETAAPPTSAPSTPREPAFPARAAFSGELDGFAKQLKDATGLDVEDFYFGAPEKELGRSLNRNEKAALKWMAHLKPSSSTGGFAAAAIAERVRRLKAGGFSERDIEVLKLMKNEIKPNLFHQRHYVATKEKDQVELLEQVDFRQTTNPKPDDLIRYRRADGSEVQIKYADILDRRNPETARRIEAVAAAEDASSKAATEHFFNVIDRSKKEIYTAPGIHVYSPNEEMKQTARRVASGMTEFDQHLAQYGFERPASTSIVMVKDQPPGEIYTGPMALSGTEIKMNGKKHQALMLMEPFAEGKNVLADRMVMAHERTHNAMHATYRREAFVNQSDSVQEALADFVPAHRHGSHKLFSTNNGAIEVIRDVEQRTHMLSKPGEVDRIGTVISPATRDDSHRYALFYSGTLWRVREKVGRGEMDKLLKPLVDDLNLHYVTAPIDKARKGWEGERESVRYFLASVMKTAKERGLGDKVTPVIQEMAAELKVGVQDVDQLSRQLSRSGRWSNPKPVKASTVIFVPQAGAAASGGGSQSSEP